jgi:hypothetical protein
VPFEIAQNLHTPHLCTSAVGVRQSQSGQLRIGAKSVDKIVSIIPWFDRRDDDVQPIGEKRKSRKGEIDRGNRSLS